MVGATGFEPATTCTQERSRDAQADSPEVTTSQAVETTTTHCAAEGGWVALRAAGVTDFGEPVVIPLDELIDAAFEAEAWALDARLACAESAQAVLASRGHGIDGP